MVTCSKIDVEERWVTEKKKWNSIEELVLFLKHKKAYRFAEEYCKNKYVLDYGCGSGYGTALLSKSSNRIIGVDINEEIIDFCTRTYNFPNLSFQKINNNSFLPFVDKSFDVIVTFQVIEHIHKVQEYLFELKRVLKDEGILFISTPNRKYRLLPFQKPWNKEHVREYNLKGFRKELMSVFKKVEILGVYGTKEINRIEHKRARQNPVKVYFMLVGKKMLKVILPSRLFLYLKNLYLKNLYQKTFLKKARISSSSQDVNLIYNYSIDDIIVGKNVGISLDFLAICYKE